MSTVIDLDNASREEMKQYGMDELGISLSMAMREDTMRQKVRDEMTRQGIKEGTPPVKLGGAHGIHGDKSKWVTINIQRTEDKRGNEPVFVGFQGKGYTIPRGVDVAVPPAIEHILNNAIKTLYSQDVETLGELIARDVPSYPYQIVAGRENRVGLRAAAA